MYDLAIVGAGFGGLGMALRAAELGLKTIVLESLNYPGGCASTHTRRGAAFESGATLFSGLGPEGHFTRTLAAHGLELPVEWLDPVLHVRAPGLTFDVPRDRAAFVRAAMALEPAYAREVEAFFAVQARLADPLWRLFDDPALLPPFGSARALMTHASRALQYAPLLPWIGKPLAELLESQGLGGAHRLRHYVDALCQISVQAVAAEAESPFALATLDYPFRGTGHVEGGIGTLARALVQAFERAGGTLRYTSRVDRVERDLQGFVLHGRRGEVRAARLACNLLPAAAARLSGESRVLRELDAAVRTGWGAVMQYRRVRGEGLLSEGAHHVDLTNDLQAPLSAGNHVFCSVGAPDAEGLRSVTLSTHVNAAAYARQDAAGVASAVQATIDATVRDRYPALAAATERNAPASPRTFERFVGRRWVGGIPRRAGLHHYAQLWPVEYAPRAWLIGDTVFPGQSTLAAALGGHRAAEAAARS